jgi:hypothetical protein
VLRVINCIARRVRPGIPQATEWQRIGNQIDATMIFARADFVNVHHATVGRSHFNRKPISAVSTRPANENDSGATRGAALAVFVKRRTFQSAYDTDM